MITRSWANSMHWSYCLFSWLHLYHLLTVLVNIYQQLQYYYYCDDSTTELLHCSGTDSTQSDHQDYCYKDNNKLTVKSVPTTNNNDDIPMGDIGLVIDDNIRKNATICEM